MKKILLSLVLSLFSFTTVYASDPCACLPQCVSDPFIYAEYLYWNASSDQLHFAATGVIVNEAGKVYELNNTWDSGFRIGAGARLFASPFRVSTDWLYYYTNDDEFVTSNMTLRSTLASPNGLIPVQYADANWYLRINSIRLNLDYQIQTSCPLILTPRVAIRGEWIKQRFLVNYEASIPVIGNTLPFVQNGQKYWGIGPESGIDAFIPLWRCLSLYSDCSFALLWGNYTALLLDGESNNATDDIDRPNFTQLQPIARMAIGFSWEQLWCSCYHLNIRAGWEGNVWFSHVHQMVSAGELSAFIDLGSNLTTSGLVVRGTFSF